MNAFSLAVAARILVSTVLNCTCHRVDIFHLAAASNVFPKFRSPHYGRRGALSTQHIHGGVNRMAPDRIIILRNA
jgi:hypothetical protein